MDRMELITLLNHLAPDERLAYLAWVCRQAVIPGTFGLHPGIAPETRKTADRARHCDRNNEKLTIDIIADLSHMSIDYAVDLDKCIAELVRLARGKN